MYKSTTHVWHRDRVDDECGELWRTELRLVGELLWGRYHVGVTGVYNCAQPLKSASFHFDTGRECEMSCHDIRSSKESWRNRLVAAARRYIVRSASCQKSLLPVTESRVPKKYSTCDVTVGSEERSAVAQFQPEIWINGEGRGRRLSWGRSEGGRRGRG